MEGKIRRGDLQFPVKTGIINNEIEFYNSDIAGIDMEQKKYKKRNVKAGKKVKK